MSQFPKLACGPVRPCVSGEFYVFVRGPIQKLACGPVWPCDSGEFHVFVREPIQKLACGPVLPCGEFYVFVREQILGHNSRWLLYKSYF